MCRGPHIVCLSIMEEQGEIGKRFFLLMRLLMIALQTGSAWGRKTA